ncbi:MAG: M48 family metalloprotease [Pseudomonadales bacterium]|nr:M48 family metalloprotease [Pseudomonadales bacterium]
MSKMVFPQSCLYRLFRLLVKGVGVFSLNFLVLSLPIFAGPGEKLYNEFVEKDQIYQDDKWQTYVQDIGERLLAAKGLSKNSYYFSVLDNPVVNAFALPDGYIFVNRGLIAYLDNEDQLAAVIGHEIGHVALKHASKRNVAQKFGGIAGFVAAVMTGRGELMDLSNQATATIVSGYGRDMELESDEFGGEVLALAGYNPLAMIQVVMVLKDHESFSAEVANARQKYHGVFSTHPKNDKRLHEAVQKSQSLLPDELAEPVGVFDEFIDGLVFGDEAASGLVREQSYYHSGLRLVVDFPDDWDVSNSSNRVWARHPGGASVGFINFQLQDGDPELTPEQYIKDKLKRDDVLEGEEITFGDSTAYIGSLDASNKTAELDMIAVVYQDGATFLLRGEAGSTMSREDFKKSFKAVVESIRAMNAEDLKVANDQRINLIESKPGDTYKNLARKSSIKQSAEQTLRVINGDYPLGEPRPGDRIKIVR